MENLTVFCRMIRARTQENRAAMHLIGTSNLAGPMVGILRQELDSMIRVIYLLCISDNNRRTALIEDSIRGLEWMEEPPNQKRRITDREMVNLANGLQGWSKNVYKFGCAFVHLSRFHDYLCLDPMSAIEPAERGEVAYYMNYYHGTHFDSDLSFSDIVPYLPAVFEKISSNLECYLKELEDEKVLSEYNAA